LTFTPTHVPKVEKYKKKIQRIIL